MSEKEARPRRLYWDADVFLSVINADPERLPVIEAIFDDCDKRDVIIHTSVLSIAEVAFASSERLGRQLSDEIEARIEKLWGPTSPIKLDEISQHIARDARILMRQAIPKGWSLKPRDAIHIATAKRRQVDEFHTYDTDKLSKFSEIAGFPIVNPRIDRLLFRSR